MPYHKPFKCPTCGRDMLSEKSVRKDYPEPPLCPVCDILEKPDETPDNGDLNDGSS